MATRFQIKAPIWDGHKEPKVGLAESRMFHETLEVEILYTNKQGVKPFPHLYRIARSVALRFPAQKIKGVVLRVIPLKAFKEVPR